MGLFPRLQPEEVEGFFPLPAVPAPQLKMVDPPPTSTGGAKSQPLAEQNRSGRRHLWRNGYDLGAPHGEICKQFLGEGGLLREDRRKQFVYRNKMEE